MNLNRRNRYYVDNLIHALVSGILFFTVTVMVNSENSAQRRVNQGTAKVNGTSIFYETQGRGFPIVFVSGGGILDRRGWGEQFETFAKHYRVVRYDIRGIGKSARPQGSFSHSQDLYALLSFLKITRAHVVGLSVGGAIAIDFAIEHPEVVDHLILAASGLSSDSKTEANLQSLTAIAGLVKAKGIEHVIQLTLDTPFVLSKQNAAGRAKVRQIYLDNQDVFESGFPLYVLWQPIQPPPENRLAGIRARVLVIRGDSDSPAYAVMTDKISKGIPQSSTVVIPGGTHFLNLEKPAEFNQAVLDFLRR
jgi:3-oxoadipate enol-lactonase